MLTFNNLNFDDKLFCIDYIVLDSFYCVDEFLHISYL